MATHIKESPKLATMLFLLSKPQHPNPGRASNWTPDLSGNYPRNLDRPIITSSQHTRGEGPQPGPFCLCSRREPEWGRGSCLLFHLVSPIKRGEKITRNEKYTIKKITFNFLLLMSVRWFLAWQEIPDGLYNEYNLIRKTGVQRNTFFQVRR